MPKRTPKYQQGQRSIAPLSDGRTVGVCRSCGKQHPPARPNWNPGQGCANPESVFIPEHMKTDKEPEHDGIHCND